MLANIIDCFHGHNSKFWDAALWLLLISKASLFSLLLFLFRFFDYRHLRDIFEDFLYLSFPFGGSIKLFFFKSFWAHSLQDCLLIIFDLFNAIQVSLNLTNRHLLFRIVLALRKVLIKSLWAAWCTVSCLLRSSRAIRVRRGARVTATLCLFVFNLLFLVTKSISNPECSYIGHFIYTN